MNPITTPAGRPVYAFDSLPEFVVRLPPGAAVGLALGDGTRAVLAYHETPQRVLVCAVATAAAAPQWSGAPGPDAGSAVAFLADWLHSVGRECSGPAAAPPAGVDAASLPLDRAFLRERAAGGRGLSRRA